MSRQKDRTTKRCLLVLASTYPRWKDDPEPGFVHELSRRLTDMFEVIVVCPAAPGAPAREVMDGVRVRRFRYAPRRWQTLVNHGGITTNLKRHPWKYLLVPGFLLSMLMATLSELRQRSPDVIHAHWLIPQGFVALLACLLFRSRASILVTSHGADLHGWKNWPFSWAKRWTARRADALTVVSQAMAQETVAFGVPAGRIQVAPMGVDLRGRFHPDTAVARAPHEILFVGRLVEKKGLRYLIAAMPAIVSGCPDARLIVAGFGPEERVRKEQVAALGMQAAVHFLGPVPQSELPALYRRATVFVAPFVEAVGGDRDGLGLVLVEAAGSGCPVVVSDVPAVHDVFGPGEAVLVPPADSSALSDAVLGLLQDCGQVPRSLPDSLAERFDWDFVTRRYAHLLGEPFP